MRLPSISVIMPVFNGEGFLVQAIQSVLDQQYPQLEVLVIDDASTDDSAAIARNLGATVISLPQNLGPAAARNRGIEAAQGELIAFLDADDVWVPQRLERQVKALNQHPELGGVGGYFERFGDEVDHPNLIFETYGGLLTVALFHRNVFETVGLLDESLWSADDTDWFLRMHEQGIPFAMLNQVVLRYRAHQHGLTADVHKIQYNCLRVIRKRMRRFAGSPPPLPVIPILEIA